MKLKKRLAISVTLNVRCGVKNEEKKTGNFCDFARRVGSMSETGKKDWQFLRLRTYGAEQKCQSF